MDGCMPCADIALDGGRKFHRRPAVFLQCLAIDLHQRDQRSETAGVYDEPRVADARGALYRYFGLSGDIERRPSRPNRLYTDTGVVDGIEPALVGHPLFGPQPAHQGDAFVKARRPLAQADAKSIELGLAITQADAQDVVAA